MVSFKLKKQTRRNHSDFFIPGLSDLSGLFPALPPDNVLLCLLQYYPLKEVLAAEYLLEDFRPDLIEMVLDKLRPEYVRLVQERQCTAS